MGLKDDTHALVHRISLHFEKEGSCVGLSVLATWQATGDEFLSLVECFVVAVRGIFVLRVHFVPFAFVLILVELFVVTFAKFGVILQLLIGLKELLEPFKPLATLVVMQHEVFVRGSVQFALIAPLV